MRSAIAVILAALVLTACGGGEDPQPVTFGVVDLEAARSQSLP